jgi:hypothetical protein
MQTRELTPNTLRVVIPSRKRARVLETCALELFPYATVTVAESEMDEYDSALGDRVEELVPHPDEVTGIAPIRQWVLDAFDEECILFVDDDVYRLRSALGYRGMDLTDPGVAMRVVENAAAIARGIGTAFFGFNQAGGDVRKFRPYNPFLLNSWAGGVVGVVGRDVRYDTSLLLRADVDFALQTLLRKRVTFVENRYSFLHRRFGLTGGNAGNRSAARNRAEIEYLKRKWGDCLGVQDVKTTTRLLVRVPRRQSFIRLASDVD